MSMLVATMSLPAVHTVNGVFGLLVALLFAALVAVFLRLHDDAAVHHRIGDPLDPSLFRH